MAIQISGTTVINNSRQLQNIASLDATSTTNIKAAVDVPAPGQILQKTISTANASSTVFDGPSTSTYSGSGAFTSTPINIKVGDYVSFSGNHTARYRSSPYAQTLTIFVNGVQVVQYYGYVAGSYASLSYDAAANAGTMSGNATITSAMVNARSGSYDVWTYTKTASYNRTVNFYLSVFNDSDL